MTDPILFWNDVALEANRVSHTNGKNEQTGPTLSSRALAIVHLAMYDAYAGVINDPANLPPYLSGLPTPGAGASADAAVAGAAYATLSALFPSQKDYFDNQLSAAGGVLTAGFLFGLGVAKALLEDRKHDPGADAAGYVLSTERGKHRPDPDNSNQPLHAPFYGARSKGFAITARHELAEPPFDNAEYELAVKEVRRKGIAPELMGTLPNNVQGRRVDETLIGIYWGYDGAAELGTPPRLYNQIVRVLADARKNSVADNARLFALVNVAMADAGILSWDQKYIHNFWRPVVGIREHDKSMGPKPTRPTDNIDNDCDPLWLPLGAPATNSAKQFFAQPQPTFPFNEATLGRLKNFTPPFPAYPSGHATFGAAAFQITRLFYGVTGHGRDDLFKGLDFVSDEFNGVNQDNRGAVRPRHTRSFRDGLWQMIVENGRSRVFLGVHWIFDAFVPRNDGSPDLTRTDSAGRPFGGVPLGLRIAEDIFAAGGKKAPKKSTVGPRP